MKDEIRELMHDTKTRVYDLNAPLELQDRVWFPLKRVFERLLEEVRDGDAPVSS